MVSLVTASIGLIVAGLILLLVRKDRLHVHHGLGWIVVAVSFALLGLYPQWIDRIAHVLGISYPPILAVTVGIALLVLKILLMDIERSRMEMRNQRLVQRLAMLESDLRYQHSQDGAAARDDDAPGED